MPTLPQIPCAYRRCGIVFQPTRRTQKFHDPACKRADYREKMHPCPLCGYVHEPDDTAVLAALDLTLRTIHAESAATDLEYRRLYSAIREFIARRHALINGESSRQIRYNGDTLEEE